MSFHLLFGDGGAVLGGTSARVPAAERRAFADAHALLAGAVAEAAAVAERVEAARAEGRGQGLAEAAALAAAEVAARVAELAAALAAEAEARRAEVAAAALAGVQAILGALDPDDAAVRLARHAVARVPADERIAVRCAPASVDRIAEALAGRGGVMVEGGDGLGALEVEILTGSGRLVAGLDIQLAALAERWGVERGSVAR